MNSGHAFTSAGSKRLSQKGPFYLPLLLLAKFLACTFESLQRILAQDSFSKNSQAHGSVEVGAHARCVNHGEAGNIVIGAHSVIRGILRAGDGTSKARIEIADNVYVGDDCIVSSRESIKIGRGTLLAHGVQIFDNDSHPMEAAARFRDWSIITGQEKGERVSIATAKVEVGEHVWLGMNTIVLKGVRIGARSVIAANSVVTEDIPDDSLAGGAPAKLLRSLKP
jgi:acetyltransferase-like isoleucine patch superfamily enzyme